MSKNKKPKIDISHTAKLANLKLTDKEKKTFEPQLEEVLGYISQLEKVDTKKIEPIGHITGLENINREDDTKPSLSQDDAIGNAPKTHNGFFKVNAIFEENDQ